DAGHPRIALLPRKTAIDHPTPPPPAATLPIKGRVESTASLAHNLHAAIAAWRRARWPKTRTWFVAPAVRFFFTLPLMGRVGAAAKLESRGGVKVRDAAVPASRQ